MLVRLVIANCQVDYAGRLAAHLPPAIRLILVKADGSVSVHNDDRAYKPLNWMSPPCRVLESVTEDGVREWSVAGRDGDTLRILLLEVLHELVATGNTVIVIEHNLEVIKTADWIVDLGPEGGDKGGRIVAQGTPEDVVRVKASYTGQYLAPFLRERREKKA